MKITMFTILYCVWDICIIKITIFTIIYSVLLVFDMNITIFRIIYKVILPNAMPPLIIAITLRIGITIIYEAALSFLGLTDPDVITWGKMIGHSRDFFFDAWWTVTLPGLAILIIVLAIALIGDGLNDAFNPKLRSR